MIYYYIGYCHSKLSNHNEAKLFFNKAHEMPEDYCFPNKIEDIFVLEEATKINDKDYKAFYYLEIYGTIRNNTSQQSNVGKSQ